MGRLIVVAGPSCVGKSPLKKALGRLHPDLAESLQPVVLYNSRAPRPGEQDGEDYHFRSREEIEKLKDSEAFVVMEVRGDMQALDIAELSEMLEDHDVFYEGNPMVGSVLYEDERLADFTRLGIFVSPLSAGEVRDLVAAENASAEDILTDVMRRKLLRRTCKQKGEISLPDLEDIERRASSAWDEIQVAPRFEWVLPNHDGEDSENWDAFYWPLGDARRTLQSLVALLRGEEPAHAEKWRAAILTRKDTPAS